MQQQRPTNPPPPPPSHPPPLLPSSSSSPSSTFSEKDLPSVKSNYHTITDEKSLRSKTCRFINEANRILKLPHLTNSTAMVFFQRFYAVHSFADHDRFEVAVACILLAAKTEETPKKLTCIIQECHKLKYNSAKRASSGSSSNNNNNNSNNNDDGVLDVNSKDFIKLKERTLLLERVILHTIGFELSIDHPHKFILEQVSLRKDYLFVIIIFVINLMYFFLFLF